ncbi:MAG: hypothetical protein J3Q66DRAFT_445255 [Benniella sp.]|nr:MAG: hypothetical protein J3Q66DRAFT_445255 [Benniella sp.]
MATDLPELRHRIAQHLDFDTLKAFSVVCKAWYLDAQPILWGHFGCTVPQERSVSPEEYAFWLDAIRKNAISFRDIWYYSYMEPIALEICDILLGQCHSLVSITMRISSSLFQGPICHLEETLRPLIAQNSVTLRRLEFHYNRNEDLPLTILLSLLSSLPHLRSLELDTNMMMVEDVYSILDGCPSSLERFSLNATLTRSNELDQGDSVNNPDYSSIPSNARPLRIKQLRLAGSAFKGTMEGILSRLAAHSLELLWIDAAYCLQISPTVRDALWRLTSLTVHEKQSGHERALPGILEAIHPHQLRRAYVYRMDSECIAKLIEKQHQSLELLSVQLEKGHTGALADILATCGRLKRLIFSGLPFVNIGTLIDPQKPWVCTELEDFEGDFGLSIPIEPHPLVSDNDVDATSIEEQFMRRLGRLTNLRCVVQKDHGGDMVFDPVTGERMERWSMEWSLASGLEHLQGLVHLRTFKILDQDPRKWIGVPEMMFIKQHWHSLREMHLGMARMGVCALFVVSSHQPSSSSQSLPTGVSLIEVRHILDRPSQRGSRMATGLPELRQLIAQYLEFATLKAFSLVCKAWYLDARPLLWSRFKCGIPQECSASPEEYVLWLDTIRKNAISFRHICYFEDKEPITPKIRDILLDQCHSLDSIMMEISRKAFSGSRLRLGRDIGTIDWTEQDHFAAA